MIGTLVYSAYVVAEYVDGSLARKYIYGPGMDNPVAMVTVSGQTETWYTYFARCAGVDSAAGAQVLEVETLF